MTYSQDIDTAQYSNRRDMLFLFYLAFFLSGFAGLIYESQWTHYLKLFLGHAAYAQALVLTIFMSGMFLGAWLIARLSHKIKDPLKWYFYVELAICVFGGLFHSVFVGVLDISYNTVMPMLSQPWQVYTYKWLISILLITPQTILLGMTFPLMVNGILRRYSQLPGNSISLLYFVNSAGAAIGVLIAGFYLMERVGLPGTMLVAMLLNFLVVMIVLLTFKRVRIEKQAEAIAIDQGQPAYDKMGYLILAAALATGCASFAYEIGWIRMLSMVLGSSMQAFELMLSAFIGGLALGALYIRIFIERIKNSIYVLGLIQILMGFFALTTIMLYNNSYYYMQWLMHSLSKTEQGYTLFNTMSYGLALFTMLPTTFCAGMTLPLMTVSLMQRGYGEKSVGDVYAWNMIGSILGILIAVSIGLPFLGLKLLINLAAMLDIATGVILLVSIHSLYKKQSLAFLSTSILTCLFTLFFIQFDTKLMASGVYRYGALKQNGEIVYHHDGRTATVSVAKNKTSYSIITNGKPDASVHIVEAEGKRSFNDSATEIVIAALPLAIAPNAKNIAVIGFGSGTTSHFLLADTNLHSVDTIEIEPSMIEGAKVFGKYVKNVFEDSRSRIIFEDAKSFFATHKQRYDVIISEPSNPWVSGVASLYTVEFYRRIKNYLNQPGYLVQWFHLYENDDLAIASVVHAIDYVFKYYQAYLINDLDFMIIASDQPIPNPDNDIFKNTSIQNILAQIDIKSVDDFAFRYVGDANILRAYALLKLAPVNSDYFPYLSMHATKARYLTQTPTLGKLNEFNVVNMLQDRPYVATQTTPFLRKSYQQSETLKTFDQIMQVDQTAQSGSVLLLANPAEFCRSAKLNLSWEQAVFSYIPYAIAYLNDNQLNKLLPVLLPQTCVKAMNATAQDFIQLVYAFAEKNYAKSSLLSHAILNTESFKSLTLSQQLMVFKLALLSDNKLNNYDGVITTYQNNIPYIVWLTQQGALANTSNLVEVNLLYAYAINQKMEKSLSKNTSI